MISVNEVFLADEISSIEDLTEQERKNMNVYFLDHYGFAFADIHGEAFEEAVKRAIMQPCKRKDILIKMVRDVMDNRDDYGDEVIFHDV